MLNGILAIILIIVVVITIVVMLVVRFLFRSIKRLRDAARSAMGMDEADDHRSRDYTGRRTQQYSYSGRSAGSAGRNRHSHRDGGDARNARHAGTAGTSDGYAQNARRTQTTSGTTIIDSRSPEQVSRKIFAADEGEYVDFEEKE